MEKKPRGKCIIINNIDFRSRHKTRHGSEIDARKMASLFTNLHFEVAVHTNVTAADMLLLLANSATQGQKDSDCLVVILMSHGERGFIFGNDGKKVPLIRGVYTWFNKDICPELQEKPKLFFVQACRNCRSCPRPSAARTDDPGRAEPTAPQFNNAESHKISCFCGNDQNNSSTWADMYFAYATIPGYTATRHPKQGARFFEAIYSVFQKFSRTDPLDDLMNKVAAEMDRPPRNANKVRICSVVKNGWKKQLYLSA